MILSCIPGGAAIYRMKKDGRFFTEYVSDGLAKLCGYDDTTKFYEYLKDNPLVNVQRTRFLSSWKRQREV